MNPCETIEATGYDIFLGGPWEDYSPIPYKQIIKAAFPDLALYDPEEHQTGDWFINNCLAVKLSRSMFILVPDFPFPLVAIEAGMYYTMHNHGDCQIGLDNLVILWPQNVVPDYPKKHLSRLGQRVETIEDGIERLKCLFKSSAS
ncbi:MAG: hypothetical protein Q7K65_05605 [Candidatus Buchananbacteria bacterium]|nr:hypothetical protein [Candidatus Buchananbacteria bacterium]